MNTALTRSFDLKEDMRLRMVDLEKKLAESEEERRKMEKTCNALMRSFREEERMRYIALNKKYEKFLQDCSVRKRRNEIILRSLRRIEDRSKALFAKTERLKLLKDRQISYLKVSEVKKEESSSQFSLSQKTVDDVAPKSVHWKTPLAAEQKKDNSEEIEDLICNRISDVTPDVMISSMVFTDIERYKQRRSEVVQGYEGRKNSESVIFCNDVPEKKLNPVKVESDFCESLAEPSSIRLKSEKLFKGSDERIPENVCTSKYETTNDKFNNKNLLEISGSVISHQESVAKLEKAFSLKEEYYDNENSDSKHGKRMGKDDIESNEKNPVKQQNNLQDELLTAVNHRFVSFRSIDVAHDEENHENMSKNAKKQVKAHYQEEKTLKSLPMSLDGIDYQNETYPESYYEQPIYHHSHTNIAADVILEEDETEQDGEEEEKEKEDVTADHNEIFRESSHGSSTWVHSPENILPNELNLKSATTKDYAIDADCFDEPCSKIKSQRSESEKNSEAEQSDLGTDESKKKQNESLVSDKSEKNKLPIKSNLIHLLESDSESYQIEHGDGVSENEVSDFDLSFQ